MKQVYSSFLAGLLVLAPMTASAGALQFKDVVNEISSQPEVAKELILLLADRNIKDEYCDVKFFSSGEPELLCNADDNSVIAFIQYFGQQPTLVENRLDQQVPVGVHPIEP